MYADAVVPSYEAAWIATSSEEVGFVVVAGYADVYDRVILPSVRLCRLISAGACVRKPSIMWALKTAEKWVAAKSSTRKAHGWIEIATSWARCDVVDL